MSNLEISPQENGCGGVALSDPPPAQTLLPREVPLGGPRGITVLRTLPHKEIRTVGPWCFVDHAPPVDLRAPGAVRVDVPPHPHMGLQTVTWLLGGEVEHRDSTGVHQVVRPGETNVMTAGRGISHSEYSRTTNDPLFLLQLWVALPAAHRDQSPHFEHHADLPTLIDGAARVRVITGTHDGTTSPAASYSPIVGAEVTLSAGADVRLPLDRDFEHGVLLADGEASVGGESLGFGSMRYLGWGPRSLRLTSQTGARLLLLGGEPLAEHLLMWWNFVGRDHGEIVQARHDWEHGTRFGTVVGDPNPRLHAPTLPNATLKPRPPRPM